MDGLDVEPVLAKRLIEANWRPRTASLPQHLRATRASAAGTPPARSRAEAARHRRPRTHAGDKGNRDRPTSAGCRGRVSSGQGAYRPSRLGLHQSDSSWLRVCARVERGFYAPRARTMVVMAARRSAKSSPGAGGVAKKRNNADRVIKNERSGAIRDKNSVGPGPAVRRKPEVTAVPSQPSQDELDRRYGLRPPTESELAALNAKILPPDGAG